METMASDMNIHGLIEERAIFAESSFIDEEARIKHSFDVDGGDLERGREKKIEKERKKSEKQRKKRQEREKKVSRKREERAKKGRKGKKKNEEKQKILQK